VPGDQFHYSEAAMIGEKAGIPDSNADGADVPGESGCGAHAGIPCDAWQMLVRRPTGPRLTGTAEFLWPSAKIELQRSKVSGYCNAPACCAKSQFTDSG